MKNRREKNKTKIKFYVKVLYVSFIFKNKMTPAVCALLCCVVFCCVVITAKGGGGGGAEIIHTMCDTMHACTGSTKQMSEVKEK